MMRLIDKTALVREILAVWDKIPRTVPPAPYEFGEQINEVGNLIRGGIRKALHCIETAPTIDAVPVVRCKDCCFSRKCGEECILCMVFRDANGDYRVMGDYDYCSYAQRRVSEVCE